jgi:DNA repair protein RadC
MGFVCPRVQRQKLRLSLFNAYFVEESRSCTDCGAFASGDPTPSQEDIELTCRLKETGDMLGIRVLDHVVLGNERFYSFSDRGLL